MWDEEIFDNTSDEELFDDTSEFERLMDDFKKSLLQSVKKQFLDEMERLRRENENLQKVKLELNKIKKEYEQKKWQLEIERGNLEQKIRRERIAELFRGVQVVMYRADYEYVERQKCNKCDENRKIHFKTPLGRDMYELCECANKDIRYIPVQYIANSFEYRDSCNKDKLNIWYKPYGKDGNSMILDEIGVIYNPRMDFSELNRYRTFFKTEKDCQAYCDWLNEKEKAEVGRT